MARAYIEGPQYAGDVRDLFTFGTPHEGVPADVLVYLVGNRSLGSLCAFTQAVLCELSEEGAQLFNSLFHPRRDVAYHLVAGDPQDGARRLLGKLTGWLIPGGDDGIVGEASASGIGLRGMIDRAVTREAHNLATGAGTYFWRSGGAAHSYTNCLARLLVEQMAALCGQTVPELGLEDRTERPVMHTPAHFGVIAPGAVVTHTLTVPGGVVRFGGYWLRSVPSLTLIAPTGQVIDMFYVASNPHLVSMEMDAYTTIYTFAAAIPGTWQAVVRLHEGAPMRAEYALLAMFEGDTRAALEIAPQWAKVGERVVMTATLEPVAMAQVRADLLRADGVTDSLDFTPIGPGLYQAVYSATVAGYVDVRLAASGVSSMGLPFDLGMSRLFSVSSGNLRLAGEVGERLVRGAPDQAPGRADLYLDIEVHASDESEILLAGDLVDEDGVVAAHAITAATVQPRSQHVSLRFGSDDLCSGGRGGSYTLTNLVLVEERGAMRAADSALNLYQTAYYPCSTLQQMPLYLPQLSR